MYFSVFTIIYFLIDKCERNFWKGLISYSDYSTKFFWWLLPFNFLFGIISKMLTRVFVLYFMHSVKFKFKVNDFQNYWSLIWRWEAKRGGRKINDCTRASYIRNIGLIESKIKTYAQCVCNIHRVHRNKRKTFLNLMKQITTMNEST